MEVGFQLESDARCCTLNDYMHCLSFELHIFKKRTGESSKWSPNSTMNWVYSTARELLYSVKTYKH